LQTDCGYTPAEICAQTLDEVQELFDYWQTYPPLRDLVAAFIGFKPNDAAADPKQYITADDMRRLAQMTGGKIPGVGGR
jgi:hypothetical protein